MVLKRTKEVSRTARHGDNDEPLIDVKILRQIGRQTSRWRGTPDRFHIKVVGGGSLHGQVFEVEVAGTKAAHGTISRIRRRGVGAEAVTKKHGRRLHGRQRGRVFHGG